MTEINSQSGDMSEIDLKIKKAIEQIRYAEELQEALKKLRTDTDATHTQTLDKITKEETEAADMIVAANKSYNEAIVAQKVQLHDRTMALNKQGYEEAMARRGRCRPREVAAPGALRAGAVGDQTRLPPGRSGGIRPVLRSDTGNGRSRRTGA